MLRIRIGALAYKTYFPWGLTNAFIIKYIVKIEALVVIQPIANPSLYG
jgi:hypothetical protein